MIPNRGIANEYEASIMKAFGRVAIAAAIGLLASTGVGIAQSKSPYDATKFWEELQKQGGQIPATFDRKKFFEDLEKQGGQSMDPQKFFEELQKQGGQIPATFDRKKFFEDLEKQGGKAPPMVKVK